MIVYTQFSPVPVHVTLHKAMAESGFELRYFRFFFVPIRPAVVFIHFPDEVVDTPSTWKMLVKFCAFILSILAARLFGSRIVWEINNIKSHERRYPLFEGILMALLTRSVAGVMHNSDSGMRAALDTYPALKRAQWMVVPESNFRHVYPERGDAARGRRILGVNEGETVLLTFGLIRRYKGADKLIELFTQIEGAALRLVIAGAPVDRAYAEELQQAARLDSRIHLIFQSIPDEEVPHMYAAVALVCAPFRAVLNSASVLLALSCGCPVIASRLGTMPDLEEQVGTDWLMLYDGELDLSTMCKAIEWARVLRPLPPELRFCDFERVATDTMAFLKQIGAAR